LSDTEELIAHLERESGDYAVIALAEQEDDVTYEWDQGNVRSWDAARALEAALADLAAAQAVIAQAALVLQKHALKGGYPAAVNEAKRILAQSPADALACNCGWGGQHDPDNPKCQQYRTAPTEEATPESDRCSVCDLAGHTVKGHDADVLARRAWVAPGTCAHENTHMNGWKQVCDDCGLGRDIE
jgi:hypothetical protein